MIALETITTAFPKGTEVVVTMADGSTVAGTMHKVDAKGVTIKVDQKYVTRSLAKVASVDAAPATPADLFVDGTDYTTADVAAALDMTARALRVELRKMGEGVGKGSAYGFTASQARRIVAKVRQA